MRKTIFGKCSLYLLALCFSFSVQAKGLLGDIPADQLPPEARETIALIKQGGPFPYKKDGYIFNNYEKHFAKKAARLLS